VTEGFHETTAHETLETTGNETVDRVLGSFEGLEGTPVNEHVAVFESAHEQLRSALSDAGNDASRS
jgi:hypothetical protein